MTKYDSTDRLLQPSAAPIAQEANVITRAQSFATAAHASIGQRRKYTNEDYIGHPIAVADIVASTGARAEVIAAALLHDVVEDTPVTLKAIEHEFGADIASLVGQMTDVSRPCDGNRKIRKELDRLHSAAASPEGQTIKLADLIDNSETIIAHGQKFAAIYMTEMRALLEVLAAGDPVLLARAWHIVHTWETSGHIA